MYKCDELFSPDKEKTLDLLLASHIRHHTFYRNQLGDNHVAIIDFEASCFNVGLTPSIIKRWGVIIDKDVKEKNKTNLALIEGVPVRAAEAISNLKGEVVGLKREVQEQREMLQFLVDSIRSGGALPANGPRTTESNATSTATQPSGVLTLETTPTANSLETPNNTGMDIVDVDMPESHQTIDTPQRKDVPQPKNALQTLMQAPRRADKNLAPSCMIPLAKGESVAKTKLAKFLYEVAIRSVDMYQTNLSNVWTNQVAASMRRRVYLAFHFARLHCEEQDWSRYESCGRRLHTLNSRPSALNDKEKGERFATRRELSRLCDNIAIRTSRRYMDKFKRTPEFMEATQKKQLVLEKNAHTAALTLGLGSRLEKLDWTP